MMTRRILLSVALLAATWSISAQELAPSEKTPIYRRSFTAVYELTGAEPVREASFSPDKTLVAFVRDNDLFVREVASGRETRITNDGERNRIINGATDWVYEEEYLFTRAYEFSPDSRHIAYLRFDESLVPEFTMMRFGGKLYPEPYTFKYPKAGEPNSVVTLHVYDIRTGRTQRVDTGAETDQYIPRIGWTPEGRNAAGKLFFYRVNRLQNLFEVVLSGGRVIYSESSPRYVERPDDETVTFLEDGDRFVVRNETHTGWWRSYEYSIERGFLREVPSEEEESETDIRKYLENPPADGREFFSFTNEAGIELYGWMMKPAGFDAARPEKYPVFMTQYSGPGSQSVFVDKIHPGDLMIYNPLLEAGYIVVCIDPRGTGGRGEDSKSVLTETLDASKPKTR